MPESLLKRLLKFTAFTHASVHLHLGRERLTKFYQSWINHFSFTYEVFEE